MGVKIFRIMSNSREFLSAEVIAEALLKQISLNCNRPNTFFAVIECSEEAERSSE